MDKLLHDFLSFEADEKLFQRKYKGVYYWQTVRFGIANIVDKNLVEPIYKKREKNKKWFGEKLHILINAIYDIRNWHKLRKADILYFDQCSYRNIDGKKVDTYFSYFRFNKKYSIQRCFYLNRGSGKKYIEKGVGTAIAEFKIYLIICLSKVLGFVCDGKENEFIYKLCERINMTFKSDIVPSQLIYRAKKASIIYRIYYRYYSKMLNKVQPKAIFVVCHYSDNLWPLYSVAREMNIPVIELQHGIAINHISYSYMDVSVLGKQLPDYLFTYGDFWTNYIHVPVCMKTFSVGNPFLENRCSRYITNEMDEKTLVIYSDHWNQNGKKLMEFALVFSDKYCSSGYKVFFKMHPSEYADWSEKYIELKENDKITVLTDEIELYQLLSMAKHHVSVASTVLYEAVVFNVNIYILDSGIGVMLEAVKPLIDFKRAYFFHDFSEFEQFILLDDIWHENFKDKIWKKGSCENAQDMLRKIISKEA